MPPPDGASPSSSMLTFRLHPAVIANLLHHRRGDSSVPRMFGCVVGMQRGRTVEIFNSFDLLPDSVSGSIDLALIKKEQDYYKIMSPRFKVLGWYSTGSAVLDTDMQTHKALMAAIGGSFYLLIQYGPNLPENELRITVYESVLHTNNGSSELSFVNSECTVEPVVSDRITVHFGADFAKGEHSSCKYPWTRRKMLIETPSGFAMLDVAEQLLLYPEEIWTWFTNKKDVRNVAAFLGFIKVGNKSVVWKSDAGPGKLLTKFIQKFSYSKPLIVQDPQLKFVIEKKLNISCWFIAHIVSELVWGINYMLEEFVPEEKDNMTDEFSVSKEMEEKIKAYGLSISSQKVGREFIATLDDLYKLEFAAEDYSGILRRNFGCYFQGCRFISDLDLAIAVEAGLESMEMEPIDDRYSKEEILEFVNYILEAPVKKAAALDILRRMLMAASQDYLQDSEPCFQKTVKGPGVVGLLGQHPWIAAAICLVCAILLAKTALSSLGGF